MQHSRSEFGNRDVLQPRRWNQFCNGSKASSLRDRFVEKFEGLRSRCVGGALVVVRYAAVVASDGQLSGYRWGIQRKRQLLARESEDH